MGVIVSNALSLSALFTDGINANNPLIAWKKIVTASEVVADQEAAGFPAINLANPSTALDLLWKATGTATQYVTFTISEPIIDYLAIAGHNFGSGAVAVSVEKWTGSAWSEIVQASTPADDTPIIFRFVSIDPAPTQIRLKMVPTATIPQAAVAYIGKLLILPRRIYVGHQILTYNRRADIVTGMSERGQFLGRVVLSQTRESQIDISNVLPATYRSDIDPWLKASIESPFFFAWRPNAYPGEVGYCWASGDAVMSNQRTNGMVSFSLAVQGIIP